MNKIYENIKAIRKSKNISQADIADKLGMYPANYGKLENGLTQLTIERLEQLAGIFGMTVIEILQYGQGVESVKVDSEKVKELENKIRKLEQWLHDKNTIIEFQRNKINANELTKYGGVLQKEYLKIREQLAKENPQLNVTSEGLNETETMLVMEKQLELSRMAFRKVLDNHPVLESALKYNLISENWLLGVWKLIDKETK
jgi:transcriptional regulator with XRE-family HTH domain